MKTWTRATNYGGTDWNGWSVVHSVTRDSDCCARANHEVILLALRAVEDPDGTDEGDATVQIAHERHWACGWVDSIMVWEGDMRAMSVARALADRLQVSAVLDEDLLSRMEHEEAQEAWDGVTMRERIGYCERAQISRFAARQDAVPCEVVYLLAQ